MKNINNREENWIKYFVIAAFALAIHMNFAYAQGKQESKESHDQGIIRSFFSGTGGMFGFGYGKAKKVKDVKYIKGEANAMLQGEVDAASEILEEAGKLGNKNLVAKYYIRDGRVYRNKRESWPKATQDEYLVNYRGYPITKEVHPILTRNERMMAEKARNEKLIAFLSYAQSDEERDIITRLLMKRRYLTDEDYASIAHDHNKKHVHQGARFGIHQQAKKNIINSLSLSFSGQKEGKDSSQ